jgi:hypothetical protein
MSKKGSKKEEAEKSHSANFAYSTSPALGRTCLSKAGCHADAALPGHKESAGPFTLIGALINCRHFN